ncbi:Uncharacterised protein [uncultured archaeon]|nr:Uncharacterised protein [uncultured archaeon]
MKPGETAIMFSKHRVEWPDDVSAQVSTRTRFAKSFPTVHSTAPLLHPHPDGEMHSIALELKNESDDHVNHAIGEGYRFTNYSFDLMTGPSATAGIHAKSSTPDGFKSPNASALHRRWLLITGKIQQRRFTDETYQKPSLFEQWKWRLFG